jgi:hypothetical protein
MTKQFENRFQIQLAPLRPGQFATPFNVPNADDWESLRFVHAHDAFLSKVFSVKPEKKWFAIF